MNNLKMERKRFLILVYIQKSQVMMFLVIPLSKTETWQEHGKVHFSDVIEMSSTDICHGQQMKLN